MIGIFDSGSGGLSVLRALRERAPTADIVYFADLKNMPYGGRTREEIGALTVLCIQKLIDEGATEIVSACNSVSVSIVLPMFEILKLPHASMIEMVGPTVSAFRGRTGRILVVATKATIDSGIYQEGFRMLGLSAHGVAIPALVPLIESGATTERLEEVVKDGLRPYVDKGFTHLVLGCTHFPLARDAFLRACRSLAFDVTLVDPAYPVVDTVCERFNVAGQGHTHFLLSKDSRFFRLYADTPASGTTRTFAVL